MAAFERELGNAGFIKVAEAFGDHAVVLFLGRARAIDRARDWAQLDTDPAVFGCVRG